MRFGAFRGMRRLFERSYRSRARKAVGLFNRAPPIPPTPLNKEGCFCLLSFHMFSSLCCFSIFSFVSSTICSLVSFRLTLLSSLKPILDSQGVSGSSRPSFFCCSCASQWWHPSGSTTLPSSCYRPPSPCGELVRSSGQGGETRIH